MQEIFYKIRPLPLRKPQIIMHKIIILRVASSFNFLKYKIIVLQFNKEKLYIVKLKNLKFNKTQNTLYRLIFVVFFFLHKIAWNIKTINTKLFIIKSSNCKLRAGALSSDSSVSRFHHRKDNNFSSKNISYFWLQISILSAYPIVLYYHFSQLGQLPFCSFSYILILDPRPFPLNYCTSFSWDSFSRLPLIPLPKLSSLLDILPMPPTYST